MTESLSLAQARRVALCAQGFLDPRHATPTLRTFDRTLSRTGVLQVDSVNVLQRAHYMPLFSRMGPYDVELLRRAAERKPRRIVEYWAHVQAFMPVDLWPVMRHRMDHYRAERGKWLTADDDPGFEAEVLAEVRSRGEATARDLDDGAPRSRENWGWNWSAARKMLDYLYMSGQIAIARRNGQFEVVYSPLEKVLPRAVLEAPTPNRADALVELVRRAARSHGVASPQCLGDYYRIGAKRAAPAIAQLVEEGELLPVKVDGWKRPAFLHRDARLPRRVGARALLSPFDPVVWERARTEALFDFHYRIEIYVPADKRRHGYYVLPFLLGDRIVGRVDLKADRPAGRLVVKAAYAEPDAPPETAAELSAGAPGARGVAGARRHHGRAARRPGAGAPSLSASPIRSAPRMAPGRARIAVPSRAAAARCGPSPSSASMCGASSPGLDDLDATRPAPAAATALPTVGWSVIRLIGRTSTGRSCANACMVVPCPPCPTSIVAFGISSTWGTNLCTSTWAGWVRLSGSTSGPVVTTTLAPSPSVASMTFWSTSCMPE